MRVLTPQSLASTTAVLHSARCFTWVGLVLGLVGGPLTAQAAAGARARPMIYGTAGFGPGTPGDMSFNLGLSVHSSQTEYTLRYVGTEALDISVLLGGTPDYARDVAFLVGIRSLNAKNWLGLALGPGFAWSTTFSECLEDGLFGCATYRTETEQAIGLAFNLVAGRAWVPIVGNSVSVFGNLNTTQSFIGASVNLNLGVLR